jgi:hypothetical protein
MDGRLPLCSSRALELWLHRGAGLATMRAAVYRCTAIADHGSAGQTPWEALSAAHGNYPASLAG